MAASAEPVIRRKFILSEFDANHNKEWQIEWWEDGTCVTKWGRVGDSGQSKTFSGWTRGMVASKVDEKERKGYKELILHTPTITSVSTAPTTKVASAIERIVELIFREAGEHIKTYLTVGVDQLSQAQIAEGRALLAEYDLRMDHQRSQSAGDAASKGCVPIVQRYYNTIPTIAPRKIDPVEMAHFFDTEKEENRLNQLEAALSTITAPAGTVGSKSQYDLLGIEIIEPTAQEDRDVRALFDQHSNGTRLKNVYSVRIPSERARFEANKRGISHISSLWHGTKAQNVRHILKAGFKIPDHYSHGWMFGPGIYFADKARKSQNYTSSQFGTDMMFLSDVAIGKGYLALRAESFRQAPSGYDSVFGNHQTDSYGGSKLANPEYIVYTPDQTTIRYIVTY